MARRSKRRRSRGRSRPTRAGWLVAAGALLVGLAAAKSHAPLLYVLFGAVLGALATSLALSHWMVAPIQLRRGLPDRAWQNQTVHVGYYLRNVRRRGGCLGIEVEELAAEGVQVAPGYCLHLPAGGAFRSSGRFVVSRRGRLSMPGLRVKTQFPFGLASTIRQVNEPTGMIVWPALGQLRASLLHRGADRTSRAAPSEIKGGQDEFFGLREYRAGDDPRWIHWRRSAGRDNPVIREMTRRRSERLWVVVDNRAESLARREDLEPLLRFAATVVERAFARGFRVGCALAGANGPVVLPPAAGRGHRRNLLDALALAEVIDAGGDRQLLEHLPPAALRYAQVIVATSEARAAAGLAAAPAAARDLTVVAVEHLDAVFEDGLRNDEGR